MCGIAGMIGIDHKNCMENMLETMRRRGPDGSGIYQNEDTTLLHTRLAVIDPEGGKQPMELDYQGEHYVITYNGELYNTLELRQELQQLGHVFVTSSDTEVVLHGFVQWGSDCLNRFNGIFAFAVWGEREKRLFLARDRIGVKPLFFKRHEGGLLFASEIKTILRYPTVKAVLEADGAAQILLLGPGRIPGSGVLKGIEELEAGQYGWFQNGKLRISTYWHLTDREHTDDFEQTAECVRYLVTDAIQRQMVSDVPLGTFLSGGLDSSLISAVCAEKMGFAGERLTTFSVDYENNDAYFVAGKFQPTSDGEYIRMMQRYLNSNHYWSVLTPENLVDHLEQATAARDLPGMADVDFSLLAFCDDIRQKVTVALSGECADEIFGGYPWYRDPQVRAREGFPWAQNTQYRAMFLHPRYGKRIHPEEFVDALYQDTVNRTDILPGRNPDEIRMKQMIHLNHRWFMQTLLDRKDRMSMYNSLEVRVPFCDYRIAEYLYSVPWEYKEYQGREKGLLRYAMRGYLPDAVMYRKKSPYPKTHDPRYLELVRGMLNRVMEDAGAPIYQLVSENALRGLMNQDTQWPWYGQLMKQPQSIAYMLQINYWLRNNKISVE